jgi:hypothetical protein
MSFSSPIFLLTTLLLGQLAIGCAAEKSLAAQGIEPVNKPIRIETSTSRSASTHQEKKQPRQNQDEFITFTPPEGWVMADVSMLPPSVRVMVVGKPHSILPPSINLATEPYQGTLKQYLKTIKKMNEAKGHPWKDLGTIRTKAGTGSLSQVDFPSKWGDMRMMHVILVRNGHVYILSASSLKSEFPLFYNAFFSSLRSLRIVKDPNEAITDPKQKEKLRAAVNQLTEKWNALLYRHLAEIAGIENPQPSTSDLRKKLFHSDHFQNAVWIPFLNMINEDYKNEAASWKELFVQKIEDSLLTDACITKIHDTTTP